MRVYLVILYCLKNFTAAFDLMDILVANTDEMNLSKLRTNHFIINLKFPSIRYTKAYRKDDLMQQNESIQNILPPIVDEKTRVLIVGSMPGQQSLDKQQYYGNARNHFWPIIGEILQTEIPTNYAKRIQLLRANHIGLWDVIQSCERKGSLDSAIRNEVPNDFAKLFDQYPAIKLILFNGTKSFDVFKKRVGFELLANRHYEKMPSTSPVPGKNIKPFEGKLADWRIIESYL